MLRSRPYTTADRHTPSRILQTYLDDELDTVTAALVRRHLVRCHECVADADSFRAIRAAIRSLGLAPDPMAMARLRLSVDAMSAPPVDG